MTLRRKDNILGGGPQGNKSSPAGLFSQHTQGDFAVPEDDPTLRSRQSAEPNHREQKTWRKIFHSQTFQSSNSLKSLVEGSDSAFVSHSKERLFLHQSTGDVEWRTKKF